MLNRTQRIWIVSLCAICALLGPQTLRAQSRKRVVITQPGTIEDPGSRGINRDFSYYSFGLGNLSARRAGGGGNLLQGSVTQKASFALSRRGGRAGPSSPMLGKAPQGQRRYSPVRNVMSNPGGIGLARSLSLRDTSAIGTAHMYMADIAASSETALKSQVLPITSLVPTAPGLYRTHMMRGEEAFREGDFHLAHSEFQSANHIGGKDPESLLSLAHAAYARSRFSYNEGALHMRRVLKVLPELPLVPLQPKVFFGEGPEAAERYTERIERLEERVTKSPQDANALLLLGYFRWFEGDVDRAHRALAAALAGALRKEDEDQLTGIRTFWDGMVASGKISGDLKPAKLRRPTTRAITGPRSTSS